jgi:hypothetical protein
MAGTGEWTRTTDLQITTRAIRGGTTTIGHPRTFAAQIILSFKFR